MTDLPEMGAMEPFVTEDPEITMEEIFGEIHPEGQQTGVASPTVGREEAEPKVIVAKEAIEDRSQEEVRAEEDLPAQQPVTPVATGPPLMPDVSSTQKASSSLCQIAVY